MLKFKKTLPIHDSRRTARSPSRRGAAMVEFAIVLPMLLLMILGIIEMGRVMMLNQITTNACREASRRAIIPGMTSIHVRGVVNQYLDAGGISDAGRVVTLLDKDGNETTVEAIQSHGTVTVEVQIPYAENTWGFTAITGSKLLVSRSTMRRE